MQSRLLPRAAVCTCLAISAAGSSGCLLVAAGAAVGAAGYAYSQGKLSHSVDASLPRAWDATLAAVSELGIAIRSDEHTADSARLVGTYPAEDLTVRIQLTRRTLSTTDIDVRVGIGDEERSRLIMDRILANL